MLSSQRSFENDAAGDLMAKERDPHELGSDEVRWRCDLSRFGFKTTDDVDPCQVLIGQDRALSSLKLGFGVRETGYNIFVSGEVGVGRTTAVRRLLEERRGRGKPPEDLCYLNNFREPDRPRLLVFPAGRGCAFRDAMEEVVVNLKRNLPQIFEAPDYRERRKQTIEKLKEEERERIKQFEKKVESSGFALVQVQAGPIPRPVLMPLVAGNAIEIDQLENLVEAGKFKAEDLKRIRETLGTLQVEMENLSRDVRKVERRIREEIDRLDRNATMPLIKETVDEVRKDFPEENVSEYLDEAAESILEELDRFREPPAEPPSPLQELTGERSKDEFLEYQVNVIVDNSELKGSPVIFETSPSYKNLFGMVERFRDLRGVEHTNFTQIRAGSLLHANGGFLVLNAMDVLAEPGVYHTLKRNLRNKVTEIQSQEWILGPTTTLKPEPIPLSVKVVLIGTESIYRLLLLRDEDFAKVFKVKAEFDNAIELNDENLMNVICYVKKKCNDDGLLPFEREALEEIIETAMRMSGRTGKISTRFDDLADLVRESSFWAVQEGKKLVERRHVAQALEHQVYRTNLIENRIQERIAQGTILLDVSGKKIGQVNALALYDLGDHTFGIPARVSATVAMGRSGVVNIEREARLSGATHDKGVLILSGYLRRKYAQDKPLTMTASLAFEQNYSGVDGDSASSAEAYAILSALAQLPIRQDLAVTGSINQAGEIQPIGGVNEKVEGFFDACRARGISGTQGVLIPDRNVPDLMLRHDVTKAVEEGKFHIYAHRNVDEGITLLSGVQAGEPLPGGGYPEESVNFRVNRRLLDLAQKIRNFAPPPSD
jgi:lon-related putative ATP-dependent protease